MTLFAITINASPWNFRDENTSGCGDLNLAIKALFEKYTLEISEAANEDRATQLKARIARDQAELEKIINE